MRQLAHSERTASVTAEVYSSPICPHACEQIRWPASLKDTCGPREVKRSWLTAVSRHCIAQHPPEFAVDVTHGLSLWPSAEKGSGSLSTLLMSLQKGDTFHAHRVLAAKRISDSLLACRPSRNRLAQSFKLGVQAIALLLELAHLRLSHRSEAIWTVFRRASRRGL